MSRPSWMVAAGVITAIVLIPSSSSAQQSMSSTPSTAGMSPAQMAKADGGIPSFSAGDIAFMQGMIGHHAQAIVMATWAASHGARPNVKILAERIIVSQNDEINSMGRWLRARNLRVPEADTKGEHAGMDMPGMDMSHALMPGMLTPEQMKQLNAAQGPDFDRLFLTFMIQHHTGALTMVDKLMESQGAAQDDVIFKFASDVQADQSAEIDRMTKMLEAR